jgi:predicted O-methyltransferase YrrM
VVAIVPDRERRRELRKLAKDLEGGGEPHDRLARGLRAIAVRRPGRDAVRWSERIEAERARLKASDEPLSKGRGQTVATVSEVARASVSPEHAWTLWALTREAGARRVLEMGTCVGVSGSYLAAASGTTDAGGTLRTLEGHEDRALVARDTFRRLGLRDAEVVVGSFAQTLEGTLDDDPFDIVFIDGHHDHDATLRYVDQVRAACRPGAVLVLDDIAWSEGMTAAWHEVQQRLQASAHADLGRVGVVVLGEADAGR